MKDEDTSLKELREELLDLRSELARLGEDLAVSRAQARAAQEDQTTYRGFFDDGPIPAFRATEQGTFLRVNKAYAEMLGYESPEALMASVKDIARDLFVVPDKRKQIIEMAKKEDRLLSFENEYRRKDGTQIVGNVHVRLVRNEDQSIKYIEGVVEDITSRKRAEQALRESERFLANVFAGIRDGISVLDKDFNILRVNAVVSAAFAQAGSLEGRKCYEAFHGRTTLCEDCPSRRAMETGLPATGVVAVHRAGADQPRWVELYSYPLIAEDTGQITGIIEHIRDITEQRRMEQAQRESEATLRTVLQTAPISIGMISNTRVLLWVNENLCKRTGYTSDELVGQSTRILYDNQEEFERVARVTLAQIKERGIGTVETRCRRKDGSLFDLQITSAPITPGDLSGGLVFTSLDISDAKRARDALKESEWRYKLLTENSLTGIFIHQDGRLVFVNDRLAEMTGYRKSEIIGQEFWLFVHPEDREMVKSRGTARSLGLSAPPLYDFRAIGKDGQTRWLKLMATTVLYDGRGATMGNVLDITEEKRAGELLIQTERLKAVADLAGGVAHNFNNLLQIVMGGIELALLDLRRGNLAPLAATLERTLRSVRHGAETVRRLQKFARISEEEPGHDVSICDLSDIAVQAVEMSEPWWKTNPERTGIKVNLTHDLPEGCVVQGKEGELFEVVLNLVKNAAEALPQGGDIRIGTFIDGDRVLLKVHDTGVGIPRADLSKVFEPFWSTKGFDIGTGMGLAVSHGIIARHGGEISVESVEGRGTTFTIELPLAQAPPAKAASVTEVPQSLALSILIIDDTTAVLEVLESFLTMIGHRVFTATSGAEGLRIFEENRIDLTLCDLIMPDMNGWEVGKVMKEICRDRNIPKPPFLLLTGWTGQNLPPENMMESAVDGVIDKPVDVDRLAQMINTTIADAHDQEI
ncbi:MAG: PAS domain S-box protein [Thermodesulfobacteriota bacterium]